MKRLILTVLVLGLAALIPSAVFAADNLTQPVRARIENDLVRELGPRVGVFDYISFQVEGNGTVTLFGQVRDPMLKRHAAEDAKKVEGVKRVQNSIEVLPLSPSDDDIRRAVYVSIYSQNGFERYRTRAVPPVHIIVKNGAVTLEGFVANRLEYSQVKAAANNVPGVFSVKNNLQIDK
jgi:hyperosmotically inducible protein